MKANEILAFLNAQGPILFGVGFMAPLLAQSLDALGWPAPFGLPPLLFGLIVGVSAGFWAKRRGGNWL